MRAPRLACCALAAVSALTLTACSFESKSSPTTPESAIVTLLLGDWKSSGSVSSPSSTLGSCGNFQWQVTSQNGDVVTGTFSATCAGGVSLDGSATGTSHDNQVTWTANGTAHIPNQSDCPFTLSGVATVDGNTATLPYSGSSCLGSISGTETLTKQ